VTTLSKNAARTRRKKTVDQLPKENIVNNTTEELYAQKQPIPKLEPKTDNQKLALAMLRANKPVVFLTGSAGTGKSMIAAYHAASQLKQKRISKVYLIRPAIGVGKSIGLLPGSIDEKLNPYFAQTLAHLEKFMGSGFMHYCIDKNIIEMQPTEYIRGMSFENVVVIAEEVQNFTFDDFEMMLTRLGENCTIIFTGDFKQNDLKGKSGLNTTIELIEKTIDKEPYYLSDEDLNEMEHGIGVVVFTPEDVVRSGITRAFVKMYHNN
jgi:phosphate starvation-inducible PhoH-like protein